MRKRVKRARRFGRNPVAVQVRDAAQLYERFTGHPGDEIARVVKPKVPSVALAIGRLLLLGYETIRDGKRERYIHRFSSHARPLLVSSHDGRTVFLLGGAYTFTDRGIVDRPRR